MVLLLGLLYAIPIYLVFFKFQWLRLNAAWITAILFPPLAAGIFVWFGIGRYTPITSDAYVQAFVVQVASQIDGSVAAIHVVENQIVEKGQPLFRIETGALQEKADQARAQLVAAQQAQLVAAQQQSASFLASWTRCS